MPNTVMATPVQAIPLSELSVQATPQSIVSLIRSAIREKRYDEAYNLLTESHAELALVFRTSAGEGISALPIDDVPYVWEFIDQCHDKNPELAEYYSLKNTSGQNYLECLIFRYLPHFAHQPEQQRILSRIENILNTYPAIALSREFQSRHYFQIVKFIAYSNVKGQLWDQILQDPIEFKCKNGIKRYDNALEYTLAHGYSYPGARYKGATLRLLSNQRFKAESLNTERIQLKWLMDFMESVQQDSWVKQPFSSNTLQDLSEQYPRIGKINSTKIQHTQKKPFYLKNKKKFQLWPGYVALTLLYFGAIILNDPITDSPPIEYLIFAAIILFGFAITAGIIEILNTKSVKSLEHTLVTQDEMLLSPQNQAQLQVDQIRPPTATQPTREKPGPDHHTMAATVHPKAESAVSNMHGKT